MFTLFLSLLSTVSAFGTPSHVQIYERDLHLLPPDRALLYARAPGPSVDPGSVVNNAVNSQIKNDVQAVIQAFDISDIPQEVLDLVQNALNTPLSQYLSNTPTDQQLNNLANQVDNKLADIQDAVIQGLTEGEDFQSLRNCIKDVVSAGGTASGQQCLLDNGADVDDLKEAFKQTVSQYNFVLPIQTMNDMIARIDSYLASSSLIEPAKQMIKNIESALQSVVATTAGDYTEAINDAADCFFAALSAPVYSQADVYDCEVRTQNANGTYEVGSTLTHVENMYRAVVNQYIGYLQPNIVQDIQAIGQELLPQGEPGSPALSMADSINQAILSVVASTSGSQVSIAYQLLDCLNIVYTADPSNLNDAQSASQKCSVGSGISLSQKYITDGYIQQFYGVLPAKLTLLLQDFEIPEGADPAQVEAQLQSLFQQSGAGPEYVTCYEKFEDCTLDAIKAVEAGETAQTCSKGDACVDVPFSTPVESIGTDGTNPYADAASGIGADSTSKVADLADTDTNESTSRVSFADGAATVVGVTSIKSMDTPITKTMGRRRREGRKKLLHPTGKRHGKVHRHTNARIVKSGHATSGKTTYKLHTADPALSKEIAKYVSSHKFKFGGKLRKLGTY
ncbi:hypothetical protein BT69DRAFT_1350298 [Atractiella rhizophila]|nr:hypothetical protein BT69DRAFT_1350298 [Atractiella rhizophila]